MDPRRGIPSVDTLLASEPFIPLLARAPRDLVVATLRDELTRIRAELRNGPAPTGAPAQAEPHDPAGPADAARLAERVDRALGRALESSLRPVINATGVVLHTNLGRAPLADAAVAAMREAALDYVNLEYDLAAGTRGSRYGHCRELLMRLTGAGDALVVNNNAAALVLALNTLARGRQAVISRGELVEIGGAFRVPDILARSGARLREVGATNRTHLQDYAAALSSRVGVVLKIHPSNFTIRGYTAEVTVRELAPLAGEAGIPLVHDIGSGLLLPPEQVGLPADEPTPMSSLRDGADLVTVSGDKLLGGPQCGIVLGSPDLVGRLRENPLCRALRVDKLTLAALGATLRLYLEPERALREVPVLRMLTATAADLTARADAFAAACTAAGIPARVVPGTSAVGGGATPAAELPTALVALEPPGLPAQSLERDLRLGDRPVVARIVDGRLVLDLRTVPAAAEPVLLRAVERACSP